VKIGPHFPKLSSNIKPLTFLEHGVGLYELCWEWDWYVYSLVNIWNVVSHFLYFLSFNMLFVWLLSS